MKDKSCRCCSTSRRQFLTRGAGVLGAAAAAVLLPGTASADLAGHAGFPPPTGRYVLKNGVVISMDPNVGNFERADVLIEGKKIIAIGPDLKIDRDVREVEAEGCIIIPGFIDTHHHQHQTAMRGLLAEAILINDGQPDSDFTYGNIVINKLNPILRPEDVYLALLISSYSQLSAGVTTVVDTSQISNSPSHSDAAIQAFIDSGRRTLMAYSSGSGPDARYPQDIHRLKARYFTAENPLLSLAMGAELLPGFRQNWALAREMGIPIVSHVVGLFGHEEVMGEIRAERLLGPDNLLIHCTGLGKENWQYIAQSGARLTIAAATELTMRQGMPPFQQALDLAIQPSLSSDVECAMSADFFTQMRTSYTLQRGLINQRVLAGEQNVPALISCHDVLRFATLEGANAAHLDSRTGSLTPGKEADIVMLRADTLNVMPLNNAAGTIVTLMDTSNVDTVIVAGKMVKQNGKMLGVDQAALLVKIEASRDYLLKAAGVRRHLF